MKIKNAIKTLLPALFLAAGLHGAYGFRIVGYFPSWQGSVGGIQFGKVNDINYAFLLPNSNGSLQAIDNASKLQQLVSSAHAAGVKVCVSVGGWNNGDDSAFVSLAGNSTYRNDFVNNLISFVNQYNLDGVDIDWEYPDSSTENNYATLMSQLSSAMHSRGKLLTAAVIAYGSTGDYILNGVFGYVDWLNIMDYDNTSGIGQSTYDSAVTAIDYWVTQRGLPSSKAQLGVPFYSDPSDYAFWDLLQKGANPYSDSWGSEGYNGITTIQDKTTLALNDGIGGMMIWELSQDATGTYSLLSAMYSVVQQHSGGSLPSGWADTDIGSVGLAGSGSYGSGTFTVSGSGSDIWSTSDSFNYAHQSVSGDQTIIARVASQQNTSSWAKSGVMFRNSTAANAAYAFIMVTPANGVSFQVRATDGGSAAQIAVTAGVAAPEWVKLVRSSSTFTAFYSSDGSSWTQLGSTAATMASGALAGLAVCAHNNTALNTSTFDNVSVSASAPAPDFSLSASPNSLTITQGSSGTSTITINPVNGYNNTVSLSASGLPSGVTASFNPSSTTGSSTLTLSASSTAVTGSTTVTITGTDGTLTHTTTISLTIAASSGGGNGNIAPNGTAYGWFGMSSSTGTANQTAQPGLNDNNLTANVDLDPAGDSIGAWEAGGVIWSSPVTISSADFINGDITTGGDGFLTANLKLQFTTDGTAWTDSGWTASPAYPYSSSAGGQTYAFSGTAVSGVLGARVVGQVRTTDTSYHWILKEVQFTGSSGGGGTPDFSLSASPNSLTITQGANGTSTISVNPVNGYNNTVSLSASGLPSGVTASFNPGSTTSGSTLTLTASATAATGSTTVTISGTDGTLTHATTISLTVAASGGGGGFSGIYQIQNEASGLVLNNQGSLTNGSAITQWKSVSSSNLDWQFFPTSNGYYQINSCKSALDAVVKGASTAQGAGIIQWSFGSSGNDQWQSQQNGDGSYTFVNLHSGLVLEDPGSSTSTSAQMDQWGANGGANQMWKLLAQ